MSRSLVVASVGMGLLAWLPVQAQVTPSSRLEAPAAIANPYDDYAFLIGEWDTPGGGPNSVIHQSFRWGTNRGSIHYTTSTSEAGKPEAVHFEGLLVWNGATKQVDYLIVVEPGSGGQERGALHVEADGSVVRDVTLTSADGKTGVFRQTFRKTGHNTAVTALMRKTANGWEPQFPGSDNLAMVRRPV